MFWRFLICCFLVITASEVFCKNGKEVDKYSQSLFRPQFQNFYPGMTYQEVVDKLRQYKASLKDFDKKNFSMSIPIYELLTSFKGMNEIVDIKNRRVYYDDEVFFDLNDLQINKEEYHLIYRDPFYVITTNAISSVSVDYPTRVNHNLNSLKFKFIHNILYAIEYKTHLKDYQMAHIQMNYLNRYGVKIYKGDNHFRNDSGMFFVHLEDKNQDTSIFIIMGSPEYLELKKYLDSVITQVIKDTGIYVSAHLVGNLKHMKLRLLQNKKNHLVRQLRNKYKDLDYL